MYIAPNGLRYDTHQDYLYDLKEDMNMNMENNINVTVVADNTTIKEDNIMINMTVNDLRAEAKKAGIVGYSKMRKDELINAININNKKEDNAMFKKIETFKFKNIAASAKKALDFYHNGEDCTTFRRVDSAFSYAGDNYAIALHDDGGFGEFMISIGYGLYKETKKGWKFITEIDSKEKLSVVLRGEELWKSLDKKKFVSIVEDQFVKQSLVRYKKLFYKTECGTYDVSRSRLCGVIGDGFKKCGIKERNNHLMTLALNSFVQSCVLSQRLESDRKEGQSTYFTTADVLNNLHKMYK